MTILQPASPRTRETQAPMSQGTPTTDPGTAGQALQHPAHSEGQPTLDAAGFPDYSQRHTRSEVEYPTNDGFLLLIQDTAAQRKVVSQIGAVIVHFSHCGVRNQGKSNTVVQNPP